MIITSAAYHLNELGMYNKAGPETAETAHRVEAFIDEAVFKARPLKVLLGDSKVEGVLSSYFSNLVKGDEKVGGYLYNLIIKSLTRESIKHRAFSTGNLPVEDKVFTGKEFTVQIPEINGVASVWDYDGDFGQDITIEFGDEKSRGVICLGCGHENDYLDDEGSVIEFTPENPGVSIEILKETLDAFGRHRSVIGARGSIKGFDGNSGELYDLEFYNEVFDSRALSEE